MAYHQPFENELQCSNTSLTYEDIERMQPFQNNFDPGPDLLFGFMNDNIDIAAFDLHESFS